MANNLTFQYQDSLLKLPIPDLESTCKKYLEILQPLQNQTEHSQSVKAVSSFLDSPISKNLDEQLRRYSQYKPSYIEEFWYDSYLNYDSPVVLNLNPFFLIEDDPNPIRHDQVKRSSSITLSSLRFIRAIKKNQLPPDRIRNQPLCMYQYTKLFGSARIPTLNGCVMQNDKNSRHIVVISRSQFYWFNVFDDSNDILLNYDDLTKNFQEIIDDSYKTSNSDIAKSSFGLLTTENRRVWASIRKNFNNSTNNEVLKIIDSALFIICLDDVKVESIEELSMNYLCGLSKLENGIQVGTCTNRWYDKLQIIVTKNAKVGINFEHTGVDGHTVLRFVSDIYTDSILSFAKSINPNSPDLWKLSSNQPEFSGKKESIDFSPKKIIWELTPDISLSLRFSETRLSDLISQTEFAVLEFKNYGSNLIKKLKCSPDAFVQMSFQAAYYALYGKVECTYEPAMTKQFLHGRTEAIRTVSNESNLFVRKFFENISSQEKLDLLKYACSKHSQRTKESLNGLGVDRHLYALFCIWQRYVSNGNNNDNEFSKELPSIFADSGWDKLNTSVLSTSNCGNPALRLFGFGPVTSNGFGLAYIIKGDSLTVAACSKHRQTRRFINTLNSYFLEVGNLYNEVNNNSAASTVTDFRNNRFETLKTTLNPLNNNEERVTSGGSAALNYLLGGYGYFDVGENDMKSRGTSPEAPIFKKKKPESLNREIEKKLKLAEY